ncbi:MAG TPA: 4-hydroxyphenylpyruvate dioxygenase [Bacteriovoracaceae bacterium]|nr:4-hydroxyphenylpyruvate dioxygenase [Bacteriovoracaceae bacterium]
MTENPAGLKSIDHLEFAVASLDSSTVKLFTTMGFILRAQTEQSRLYTQGQARFLIKTSTDERCLARQYHRTHGEGVSKISFQVENVEKALEVTLKNGAKLVQDLRIQETAAGKTKTASIQGFGDVINEFVERPTTEFRPGFKSVKDESTDKPLSTRVLRIDHLTNNVPKGQMEHWVEFYKRTYGFIETRYFDIKGSKTGLNSKVVQLADNSIIIPINEPEREGGQSQIQEFLDVHKGPGVQHIALMTPDIISTVAELRSRNIEFLDVPSTYYDAIPDRPFKVTEDLKVLEKLRLLVDGDPEGYLLQIFSKTCVGPLFFEYIQRKNHWGFGNGNFQALFDAIERDQMQRGYLK